MSRLIDAEALKKTFCAECNHTILCEDCDIDFHFERLAPTVDAIPIEWMEKYADLNRFTTRDGQVIIRFRWIIDEMVADWREALEVQSNEDQGSC